MGGVERQLEAMRVAIYSLSICLFLPIITADKVGITKIFIKTGTRQLQCPPWKCVTASINAAKQQILTILGMTGRTENVIHIRARDWGVANRPYWILQAIGQPSLN